MPTLLTRSLRIRKAKEFQKVYRKSRKIRLGKLSVFASINELGHPRLGLTLRKKHIKLAVGRNRVKRVIRENFRRAQADLPAVDIVILSHHQLGELSNEELSQLVTLGWEELNTWYKRLPSN